MVARTRACCLRRCPTTPLPTPHGHPSKQRPDNAPQSIAKLADTRWCKQVPKIAEAPSTTSFATEFTRPTTRTQHKQPTPTLRAQLGPWRTRTLPSRCASSPSGPCLHPLYLLRAQTCHVQLWNNNKRSSPTTFCSKDLHQRVNYV